MGNRKPGPLTSSNPFSRPACTPGPLGLNDYADPNTLSCQGNSPGPTGLNDYAQLSVLYQIRLPYDDGMQMCYQEQATPPSDTENWQQLVSGSIPAAIGMGSAVRIPVPNSGGLFIELSPRGHVPAGGSTSSIFIQDVTGKRHLRLDYGYNKTTGTVNYHWNQKGTYGQFGIPDHAPVGKTGEVLYKSGKYFKYGGRTLLVVGAATDIYSIVVANKRMRQVTKVAAGWGGAWLGCKTIGAGGAAIGTLVEPGGGSAVGGAVGCVIGSVGGYFSASWAAGELYDYVEETYFEAIPATAGP